MALDLNDKTANANNLTNVNGADSTDVPFTGAANSQNTDSILLTAASSQYLWAADSVSLSIIGNMTLQGWVKFTSTPASGNLMAFVDKETGVAGGTSYDFSLQNSAGTLRFLFEVSDDGTAVTDSVVNWAPSTGTWYHVAVTYDTLGNVKFYVNGTQQGATQTGAKLSIFDGTQRLALGAAFASGTPANFLDGKLDDWRIYNTNRSAAAIAGDYQQQLVGNEANLNAYWPLNALNISIAVPTGYTFII